MSKNLLQKLKPAGENGYTFSQEEKQIIQHDNKLISRCSTSKLSNDTVKYINPNLKNLPELRITETEHKEIAYKTVGRVVEKLEQHLEL